MAKSLFYFTFFSYLDLLHKEGVWESVTCHSHMSQSHVRMSHDKCGKVVHRPCSSCISSVQNQMGTLSSSPCQLRLGVWLSHLRLSCYTPSPTNVITIPHITVKGEINQRIIYYLLDCSATANFISKSFSKKLNLIPISKLNEPVRGLGGKILFNAPLYIPLMVYPSRNTFWEHVYWSLDRQISSSTRITMVLPS